MDADLPRNLRRQLTPSPRNSIGFQLSDEGLSLLSCPLSRSLVLVAPASRRLSCGRPRPHSPLLCSLVPRPFRPSSASSLGPLVSWSPAPCLHSTGTSMWSSGNTALSLGSFTSRTVPPGSGCSLKSTRTLRSGSSNAGKLATCSSEYRVCRSVSVSGSMSFHDENHPGSKRPDFSARSSVLNSSQIVGRCVTSAISSPLVDTINLFPFGCVSIYCVNSVAAVTHVYSGCVAYCTVFIP